MVPLNFLQSIKFKFSAMFFLFGLIMIGLGYGIMLKIIIQMQETLITERLTADINYIEDLIGSGNWHVKSHAIYRGDVLIGDGTEEKANFTPFLEHERKTNTLSYVFIKCQDEGLSCVKDTPTQKGYQQGHFLRVAGSTKNPEGQSIVGTYIEKQVADALDKNGSYKGEANVAGGLIYCLYKTLKNKDGNTVGAVVVGRYTNELHQHRNEVMRTISISIILSVLLLGGILFLFVNRWITMIRDIVTYLKKLEKNDFSQAPLSFSTHDEMGTLVTGINHLADSLKEKEMLRKKSEIDQLTGLANRFGLNRYAEEVFEDAYKNHLPLSVGIIDIDHFKSFNDNYGHQAGDRCIVMLANILKETAQKKDLFCARFGGDEFILICKNYSREQIEEIAQTIKDRVLAKGVRHAYSQVSDIVTISQGYSYGVPIQHRKLNEYISVADSAMYQVKQKSKNHFNVVEMNKEFHPTIRIVI